MNPKSIVTILAAAAALEAGASSLHDGGQWTPTDAQLERQGSLMSLQLNLDLNGIDVPSEEALLLTPCIVSGADTVALPSVGIYGRNRYYHYLRKSPGMLSGRTDETVLRTNSLPSTLTYSQVTEYQPWMDDCQAIVLWRDYGCCFTLLNEGQKDLANFRAFALPAYQPEFLTINTDSVIDLKAEGSARIQFVVDKTKLEPAMFNNPTELGLITNSIDKVLEDSDFAITQIWLKGFASPESPYSHNADLARGRVEAVKNYVQGYADVPASLMVTEYEPEDWAGLEKWLNANNENEKVPNAAAILAIINDSTYTDLDVKERDIKSRYPADYRYLLTYVYPPLRHTDYRIHYTVNKKYNLDEVRDRFKAEKYERLTLKDYILLANSMEIGSPEYCEVYEQAALQYKNSTDANLNAANSALQAGMLTAAETYLSKAGDSDAANYDRAYLLLQRAGDDPSPDTLRQALALLDGNTLPQAQSLAAYLTSYLR